MSNIKWQDEITDLFEDLNVYLNWYKQDKDYLAEGEFYSNAGEDFIFTIRANSLDEFKSELQSYYWDFDPEEHAASWYKANRGEPSSLRALLNDADLIDNKLEELTFAAAKL